MIYYVYAHYKLDNNELFYIGVAKTKTRFKSRLNRNKHWLRTVEKHGFYYKIINEFQSIEECYNKEKELIKKYGRNDNKTGILVNMTDGGEGFLNPSVESRLKISNSLKGIKRSENFKKLCRERMLNTRLSEETKIKMSLSHKKADKSYLTGRKLSQETKDKLSKSKKGKPIGIGKKLSESHKKSISNGHLKRIDKEKLYKIDDYIKKGVSIRKTSIQLGITRYIICKYLKNEIIL